MGSAGTPTPDGEQPDRLTSVKDVIQTYGGTARASVISDRLVERGVFASQQDCLTYIWRWIDEGKLSLTADRRISSEPWEGGWP